MTLLLSFVKNFQLNHRKKLHILISPISESKLVIFQFCILSRRPKEKELKSLVYLDIHCNSKYQ